MFEVADLGYGLVFEKSGFLWLSFTYCQNVVAKRVLMIRVTSEAICKTAGNMTNQRCGKNRFLQPENFNIEMNLKFNLGPLHLLDNFVKEILASDSSQSYYEIVCIRR